MDDKTMAAASQVEAGELPSESVKSPNKKPNWYLVGGIVAAVIIVIVAATAMLIGSYTASTTAVSQNAEQSSASATPTASASATPKASQTTQATRDCGSLATFEDKQLGFSFCYPKTWGQTTVKDAAIDTSDSGYRQMVVFSANNSFSVGGQSQDWSTVVGRGVGCLEPNNAMPALTDYNTEWHDDYDDGMGMFYSRRSLESQQGGYAIEESISVGADANGWCVQGHKVINGSRYKVAFAGFQADKELYQTLADNKNNADQFFTPQQRSQYDALLASIRAY